MHFLGILDKEVDNVGSVDATVSSTRHAHIEDGSSGFNSLRVVVENISNVGLARMHAQFLLLLGLPSLLLSAAAFIFLFFFLSFL